MGLVSYSSYRPRTLRIVNKKQFRIDNMKVYSRNRTQNMWRIWCELIRRVQLKWNKVARIRYCHPRHTTQLPRLSRRNSSRRWLWKKGSSKRVISLCTRSINNRQVQFRVHQRRGTIKLCLCHMNRQIWTLPIRTHHRATRSQNTQSRRVGTVRSSHSHISLNPPWAQVRIKTQI